MVFFAIYIFDTDITVNKRVEYVIVEIPVSQKLFTLIKSVTFESYHNKDFQLTEKYSHLTLVFVVWLTQALNFKPRHKVMWHLIIFLLSLVDNAAWIGQVLLFTRSSCQFCPQWGCLKIKLF